MARRARAASGGGGGRRAVLEAAVRLLREGGLAAVTPRALCAASGVSRATMAREWPSTYRVALDAFLELVDGALPFRQARSPLARIRQHVQRSAAFLKTPDGRVLAELIIEGYRVPAFRAVFLEEFYRPRRAGARAMIEAAVRAGELRKDVDPEALIDALYGPLHMRNFIGHLPLTPAFARRHCDLVLSAVRARRRQRRAGSSKVRSASSPPKS